MRSGRRLSTWGFFERATKRPARRVYTSRPRRRGRGWALAALGCSLCGWACSASPGGTWCSLAVASDSLRSLLRLAGSRSFSPPSKKEGVRLDIGSRCVRDEGSLTLS
ncbi:hypothetical protein Y1Q_0009165 [Alligator mississippiensis]|uniref:Uncharacterized protein n=1 Tax=Alligator mississippiensis TaxID=8496 RepID=A0A151M2P7_ALLMI|nr:hypothetical protein Y1Q_0009165 [Alligator mississippiensis]